MKTVREIANDLEVRTETILLWIKSGKIEAHQTAGGHYWFDDEQLAELAKIKEMRK